MPRVSPLHSQVAFQSQPGGVVFNIADAWKFFTRPAQPACPSRCKRSFCPAFRRLSASFVWRSQLFNFEPARVVRPCQSTVATDYPPGNCDSSRLETGPDYLTRSGTVSHRSSPLSSVFRVTGTRERARGTGEYCLRQIFQSGSRGAGSTSLTRPFPGRPGLSLRFPAAILFSAFRLGSFNELRTS